MNLFYLFFGQEYMNLFIKKITVLFWFLKMR